jgi:hypothetical protein
VSARREIVAVPVAAKKGEVVDGGREIRVGDWYWVRSGRVDDDADSEKPADDAERWLGCVTTVGSNYAELTSVSGSKSRVHFDIYDDWCEFEPDADAIIDQHVSRGQRECIGLMARVRELTARLHLASGAIGDGGSEVTALAAYGSSAPVDEYKSALVLAKEETLPKLFEQIEATNGEVARWMKAKLIPFRAQAEGMKGVIKKVERRIFNVELYAGLTEQIVRVRDGEPAPIAERIRVFQRRAYMDEECLAAYEAGGMEFRDIEAFDRWIARKKNMSRLLPFPRCILAFRVRRHDKQREFESISDLIRFAFSGEGQLDKLTFLYMRNGDQLYRLSTAIEFGEQLFPDLHAQRIDRGNLFFKLFAGRIDSMISRDEWLGLREEAARKRAEIEAKLKRAPKKDRWHLEYEIRRADERWQEYQEFTPASVYYDDAVRHIEARVDAQNRLALVLQGVLDRSLVFQPHPPWVLGSPQSFEQALELIYDDDRALVAGDAPDFEAYRARLNENLWAGSITVGQDDYWQRVEARKHREFMARSPRYSSRDLQYLPKKYKPYGNPGPGKLAVVKRFSTKRGECTYEWTRERQTHHRRSPWEPERDPEIRCSISVPSSHLLHVDEYKPGDFHIFFDDPRTRSDYLQWAWLLLEAEEYHAGNRKVSR